MFSNIREDLKQGLLRNHEGRVGLTAQLSQFLHPGTQAVLVYRFGHWAKNLQVPVLKHLLLVIYFPFWYAVRTLNGVNIPTSAQIGPGLVIHTWNGVYLPACRIGYNAMFQHGVVVSYYCKEIGNHVYFGPGAKVIRPVRIGNRARIGANAVVVEDVPDDCTALGIPARNKENKRKNPKPPTPTQEHPL